VSVRIDKTYVKTRGEWHSLYRAIDKHGNPIDFLLTAKRDLDAAKRFFAKMPKDEPLMSPQKIGTDGANTLPAAINSSVGTRRHYAPALRDQLISELTAPVCRFQRRATQVILFHSMFWLAPQTNTSSGKGCCRSR
jgi:transposase-like protein